MSTEVKLQFKVSDSWKKKAKLDAEQNKTLVKYLNIVLHVIVIVCELWQEK